MKHHRLTIDDIRSLQATCQTLIARTNRQQRQIDALTKEVLELHRKVTP